MQSELWRVTPPGNFCKTRFALIGKIPHASNPAFRFVHPFPVSVRSLTRLQSRRGKSAFWILPFVCFAGSLWIPTKSCVTITSMERKRPRPIQFYWILWNSMGFHGNLRNRGICGKQKFNILFEFCWIIYFWNEYICLTTEILCKKTFIKVTPFCSKSWG